MTFTDIIDHPKDQEIVYEGHTLWEFLQLLMDNGQVLPELKQSPVTKAETRVVASAQYPPTRTMPEGRLIGQMFGRRFYAQVA